MMARLGQNLGIKLLSLFCSFALFMYVHKQQKSELSFRVPLTLSLDSTTRVADRALLRRMVSVTLSGPAERLKQIEAQARAVVDLRGRGSGTYLQPVEMVIPPDARDQADVSYQPRVLNVQLEEQTTRHLPVQAFFNVQPPPGWSLGTPRLIPSFARVSGWESDLRRVKRLQAVVNSLGDRPVPVVDVIVPIRAVDSQGLEVGEGLQVQPPTIKVQASLERSVWTKPVYVSPTLGETPPTVRLRRISVTPRRLTLRGPEYVIGPVQFLETEPISIPDVPGVLDREVRVLLPPGVKTEERPSVRVVIALQGGKP